MELTQTDFKRKKYAKRQSGAKGREIQTDLAAIPELLKLTYDQNVEMRLEAIQYLCPCHVQRNRPEVWDRLFELARDPELEVRRTVFHILGDGSPNEREQDVVEAMKSMYHDPDLKLRRRARKFLSQYQRTGKVNIL